MEALEGIIFLDLLPSSSSEEEELSGWFDVFCNWDGINFLIFLELFLGDDEFEVLDGVPTPFEFELLLEVEVVNLRREDCELLFDLLLRMNVEGVKEVPKKSSKVEISK